MPYSLVTQPLPLPLRNPGTPSSMVAVQITRVLPSSISTLPSAVEIKSGVIFTLRIWSALRPSTRKVPPENSFARFALCCVLRILGRWRQFAGGGTGCQLL